MWSVAGVIVVLACEKEQMLLLYYMCTCLWDMTTTNNNNMGQTHIHRPMITMLEYFARDLEKAL